MTTVRIRSYKNDLWYPFYVDHVNVEIQGHELNGIAG